MKIAELFKHSYSIDRSSISIRVQYDHCCQRWVEIIALCYFLSVFFLNSRQDFTGKNNDDDDDNDEDDDDGEDDRMLTPPSPQGVRKINLQVAACVKPLFKLLLMNATTKAVMILLFSLLLEYFSFFQNCLQLANLSSPIESPNGFQLLDLFISIER